MDEIRNLTVEILKEMDGMDLEQIRKFRDEWLLQLENKTSEKIDSVKILVNEICKIAIYHRYFEEEVV